MPLRLPLPVRFFSAAALTGFALAGHVAHAQQQVLNVYNWSDYIAEDTVANFEKKTGIKVNYDSFESNEVLHAQLVAGMTGYDIVVPGSHFAKLQIQGGLLQKLDKSKIPNLKNVDPAIAAQLANVDPGNEYLVDWLWGYTTVGINVDQVNKALGDMPMPENTWDLVFKPEYAARLQNCGLSYLDSASEVLPIALEYIGKDPRTTDPADYAEVAKMLKAVRPHVRRFAGAGSDYIDQMARGQLCAVIGWSGDIMIARDRAKTSGEPRNLEALLPQTGGLLFFDTMAIPADAKNVDAAHQWINYILEPEVSAQLTNELYFANANKESLPFVTPDLANNKAVFLEPEALATMTPPDTPDPATMRLITRTFTNFKANR